MNKNPILTEIATEYTSERLRLRMPRIGDGIILNKLVKRSFRELHQWMPWAKEMPSVEDSEIYVRSAQASFIQRKWFPFLIETLSDDELVGSTGIHVHSWQIPAFEIGYWIGTPYHQQGFATESTKLLTNICFDVLGANRIVIVADEANTASRRVAEKGGFQFEGIHYQNSLDNQAKLRNTSIYAKTTYSVEHKYAVQDIKK